MFSRRNSFKGTYLYMSKKSDIKKHTGELNINYYMVSEILYWLHEYAPKPYKVQLRTIANEIMELAIPYAGLYPDYAITGREIKCTTTFKKE